MPKPRPTLFRRRHFEDHVIVLCVRWYLRYCLTLRDLEEMMMERGLAVDHSTIGRWVLRYAPELNKRIRREIRTPNRSWRVDETYVRVGGVWTYLYRAVDSAGETIDFMLSPKRDSAAAKQFLQMALWRTGQVRPRVINVDGHPAYPQAIADLKKSGELSSSCRCRPSPYLNNVLEQDHRFVKKRIAASLWFRSVDGALRTIAGYEAMNMIRKGQVKWLPKDDVVGQVRFVERPVRSPGLIRASTSPTCGSIAVCDRTDFRMPGSISRRYPGPLYSFATLPMILGSTTIKGASRRARTH
jgi:transposase, IS6 family